MTEVPGDRRYTRDHEWALESGNRVRVGITDYAQDRLGDVVFVDLPEVGAAVEAGVPLGEVESTKSVADVFSPVSGTVVEVNEAVEQAPERINGDPYGAGWLVVVEVPHAGATDGLLSAQDYTRHLDELQD